MAKRDSKSYSNPSSGARSTSTRASAGSSSSSSTAKPKKAAKSKKGIEREIPATAHHFAPGTEVSVFAAGDVAAQKRQSDPPQGKPVATVKVPADGDLKFSVPDHGQYELAGEITEQAPAFPEPVEVTRWQYVSVGVHEKEERTPAVA